MNSDPSFPRFSEDRNQYTLQMDILEKVYRFIERRNGYGGDFYRRSDQDPRISEDLLRDIAHVVDVKAIYAFEPDVCDTCKKLRLCHRSVADLSSECLHCAGVKYIEAGDMSLPMVRHYMNCGRLLPYIKPEPPYECYTPDTNYLHYVLKQVGLPLSAIIPPRTELYPKF